ncbi:ATPase associated with various cellular activities AAA_5 [Desulfonatronospira thiodismutans ASO3-1]|uniref:ATPase associated with various cellular activities AAA_5 n=1 Tax=Desulfonatronospira thiodismutans ASO3-1 TaxID=555779 RepID=D6SNS5_9BACT|nr:AAA family ATPase [Desulfonatronospira thiodismutans]EFI34401.1 ATPase associated with various cellular activities AAA_5 [Desulfonatronospira thiodismutans ASO3-1]
MIKPPQKMIDSFLEWYKKDVHAENEDYYHETITLDYLSGLSRSDFIDFFYNFAHEGGRVQSGGYRTSKQFRETINSQYEQFLPFILSPFEAKFDELQWLNRIEDFKYFGNGLATIYLNRVDKKRFPILNNKTAKALQLFDIKLSSKTIERYQDTKAAQQKLIDWFPELENFFRVDSLCHFLAGEKEGKKIADELLSNLRNTPNDDENSKHPVQKKDFGTLPSLNTILYGPPGTGKTWKLRKEYMDQFTDTSATLSQEEYAARLVSDLAWWKVIAMVMMDLKESRVSEIMGHPLMQARIKRSSSANPRAAIWAHIQMHTKQECQNVKYTKRYEPLLFWKGDNSVWSIDLELAEETVPDLKEKLEEFNSFEPGKPTKVERYDFTTFHQSFSYEDFVEGIKPVMPAEDATEEIPDSLTYEVRPGIFKKMVQWAQADPEHNYALFIDEINRGNVASIFGELIALIEEDKRQGAEHELTATLPYSQTKFVVPKNLYIIGAMNTADRSVEALDTALRRRFTFIAVQPEPETLPAAGEVEGLNVDLRKMLYTINARIQKLLDKDHCIGHSYFLGVRNFQDLQGVFATKILPLLEEYFYGDPARIGMVLGEKFVSRNYESINWASGDWGQEEFDERHIFVIKDPRSLSQEDFQSIYE